MDLLVYELEMGGSPQPPVLSPPEARSTPLVLRLRRWAHWPSRERPAA